MKIFSNLIKGFVKNKSSFIKARNNISYRLQKRTFCKCFKSHTASGGDLKTNFMIPFL